MRRVGGVLPFEIRAWLAAAGAVLIASVATPTLIEHFSAPKPQVEASPQDLAPRPMPAASNPEQPSQSVNREHKAARETGHASTRAARAADYKTPSKLKKTEAAQAGPAETGRASWYKIAAKTASGETMDVEALTAAHPTLPMGTMVLVENLDNGRSVKVRINDRGPFTGNRIIDVSQAAAEKLDMIGDGVVNVRVSRVPQVMTAGAAAAP
jgi:rare lipoprotein A